MSYLLMSIVFLSIGNSVPLSPYCAQLFTNGTIEATLLYEDIAYFFTDWSVTEVNVKTKELVVKNITELFDFKNEIKRFTPPVEVVYLTKVNKNLIKIVVIDSVSIALYNDSQ